METISSFETWRLLTDAVTDPYENMALDETLLLTCNKGISPPTLRFYTWNPPAISIGYTQDPMEEIDIGLCKTLGLPIVRRITGGRAILHHDRELTYALVFKGKTSLKRDSVSKSYKMINMCLVNALRSMGIKAGLRTKKKILSRKMDSFCFLTHANNDIIVSSKKLVGSAQRRLERAFIQHGSILLSPPEDDLIKVFKRSEEINSYSFTWLNRHLLGSIDPLDLRQTIHKSFENGMGIRFFPNGLMEPEIELKQRLLKEKYLKDEWNLYKLKN